ncbi:hypothetical protein MRX96_048701 [Rhipicephalus microplus]
MDPERDAGRRAARAVALARQHQRDEGAVYVDAARYPGRRNAFAAVVVSATTGKLLTASTVRSRTSGQAEEAAIALATDKILQAAFLEGISNNKSLKKLILVGFRGDEEATGIFAGVISSNKVLRSLTIWTLDYIQPGIASAYDCWIPALIKNETLEKLEIPYQIFEPPQRARLFHALLSKENLNVHIQNWVDRHPDLSFVCAELKSGGLREKVSIGYYKFEHEIEFLQCKAFSEVHFSWPNDHTVAALHVLPSCRHITSINIRINRANVAVSSAFAEFLKSSTALRKLNLSAGLDPPLETDGDTRWWSLLHKALRRNSSLRDLSITLYGMSVQEMEALADSVGRSTSIRWVHVQPRPITNASAFVRRFSKDIERNHTLLTLICEGHIDTVVAEHWYVVQETTRRNSGIVARAARLQKAALLDRYVNGALQRVMQHPAVLVEVAELLKVEKLELVNSIRDRLEGLKTLDGFMKLAGVVEERVVCHPSDDGCTQLDALNEDCWRHIRQYLFLDDVKEGIGRHGKALSCKDLTRGNDA